MKDLVLYYDMKEMACEDIEETYRLLNEKYLNKVIVLPNLCHLDSLTDEHLIFIKNIIDQEYDERLLGDTE